MQSALFATLRLWAILFVLAACALLLLFNPGGRQRIWQQTGEEEFTSQLKGVTDRLGDLLRARPDTGAHYFTTANDVHIDTQVSPFGINVFLEQEVEPEKREQAVQMAAAAGYQWLRQEFAWEDIEIHGKGDFEDRRHEPYRSAWDKYDHIVALAEQYDMGLIVRLSNPPSWSRAQPDDEIGTYAPPDDFADFADFAAAVAHRYRGRVQYYQLWNEPNIYPEWGSYAIDPEAYTQLLGQASRAVRLADPDAVIIAGALAATIELGPTAEPVQTRALSDFVYLQRMYDAGAAQHFDIMAVQGYGLWSGPTDRRRHPRVLNIGHHLFIRDIMVQNGDGHKPIWISEMNWNAAPEDVDPRYGRVSLAQQARFLPIAYQRIQDEWPWIGVASTWYLKRATDEWEQNRQPEAYFRLLAPDFTPQPVYESMQRYTQSQERAQRRER